MQLPRFRIETSAPGRLDIGGTIDLSEIRRVAALGVLHTVNLAVEIRNHVTLEPYFPGEVRIDVDDSCFDSCQVNCSADRAKFKLPLSVLRWFALDGVSIRVRSEIPYRSGLGGSGATAVALVCAVESLRRLRKGKYESLRTRQVAMTASVIENDGGISMTGLQDQLAATYGGINKWTWNCGERTRQYTRQAILPPDFILAVEGNIAAFDLQEHRDSSYVTNILVTEILRDQSLAQRISTLSSQFGRALQTRNWRRAAEIQNAETGLRSAIIGRAVSEKAAVLMQCAKDAGCGFAFAGGNRNGVIWSIGPSEAIQEVKNAWADLLQSKTIQGRLLRIQIATQGLMGEFGVLE